MSGVHPLQRLLQLPIPFFSGRHGLGSRHPPETWRAFPSFQRVRTCKCCIPAAYHGSYVGIFSFGTPWHQILGVLHPETATPVFSRAPWRLDLGWLLYVYFQVWLAFLIKCLYALSLFCADGAWAACVSFRRVLRTQLLTLPGHRTVLQQGQHEGYILEALASIGALAWARKSTPVRAPLIHHGLSGAFKNEHYRVALHHYSRAIDKTRQVLAESPADVHRQAILMSSILFWVLETIQDNSRAVDTIGAAAIEYLPKQVIRGRSVFVQPTTEFAHFVLSSNGNNAIYSTFSPVHPATCERVLNVDSWMVLEPPTALAPERNLQEFVAVWWRFITTMLNFGVHSEAGNGSCVVLNLSAAQLASLLSVIGSWAGEAQKRANVTTSSLTARLLRTIVKLASRLGRSVVQAQGMLGPRVERRADDLVAYSDLLDCTALLDIFKIAQRLKLASASEPSIEGGSDLISEAAHDAALPALFYIARRCPFYTTRLEALHLCRPLLQPVASLSLKATYMVLQALVDVEGELLANQYSCTRCSWNNQYTALHVTLSPLAQNKECTLETMDLILDAGDYDV